MPKKGRAHRSKSPDSREQSEFSHTESEASDAESDEESSGEATPTNRRMNPAVDIKVTTEVRHAKASKSGLTVTTTTTPGRLNFYHSISFWATEIKDARRIMKTTPPYKWACKAKALELTYPKVYYQTKGGNDANIWIRVDQHKPDKYGPVPMEDSTGHYNIKISFEADFISVQVRQQREQQADSKDKINQQTEASNQQKSPTPMQNQDTQTDLQSTTSRKTQTSTQTSMCQDTQTEPVPQLPPLPITEEVIEMAKEEALEIQIENFVKISDDLHLTDAIYLVALKFIDPINALTHEREARGITEQYKQDFILQSRMFQANVINHLRKKPIKPPCVKHILINEGQKRIGDILKNKDDVRLTFVTLLRALHFQTDIFKFMFDYTHALSVISCMPEDQRSQPIINLRVHFEENMIRIVEKQEPVKPELPKIDNPEVEFLPNIIDKIREKQLMVQVHKLAQDYKQVGKDRPSGNPSHDEFLKMFNAMIKDNNKYEFNYNPLTPEPPMKQEKHKTPPLPGSPEIKLNADKDDTNFDTDSTMDDKETDKPRVNMFDDRKELRNYLNEKRKRQRDEKQEENEAQNHQQKHKRQSTKCDTPTSHRSRSTNRRSSSQTSSIISANQRRESDRRRQESSERRRRHSSDQRRGESSERHRRDSSEHRRYESSERRRLSSERRRQISPPPWRPRPYVPPPGSIRKSRSRTTNSQSSTRGYPAYFDKSKLPLYNEKSMPNPDKFRHTILADGTIVMIQKHSYATRKKQRE